MSTLAQSRLRQANVRMLQHRLRSGAAATQASSRSSNALVVSSGELPTVWITIPDCDPDVVVVPPTPSAVPGIQVDIVGWRKLGRRPDKAPVQVSVAASFEQPTTPLTMLRTIAEQLAEDPNHFTPDISYDRRKLHITLGSFLISVSGVVVGFPAGT
jgi:hypothetical protein